MIKKKLFPERLVLELTNRCNINCSYCPRRSFSLCDSDMDIELAYRLIDECKERSGMRIAFFYRGEPLMYTGLCKCIERAKRVGVETTQLSTNAFLLDHAKSHELLESEIDFISFSLSEVYIANERDGLPNLAKNNILHFLEMAYARENRGLRTPQKQVTIVEYSGLDKEELVAFWSSRVDRIRVYPVHNEAGRVINGENVSGYTRFPCKKPLTELVVTSSGEAASCSYDWNCRTSLGNLNYQSIEEVFNGDGYVRLRHNHSINSHAKDSACYDCDQWEMYYNDKGYLGELYE